MKQVALTKAPKTAGKARNKAVAPTAAPGDKAPKKKAAVSRMTVTTGMGVLIPRSLRPEHECTELDGRGWRGLVRSTTARKAVVAFVHARTAKGHLYEGAHRRE